MINSNEIRRMIAVGATLKRLRRELRWTMQDSATMAGISKGYLADVEAGRKSVSLEIAGRLAAAYGTSMAVFDMDVGYDAQQIDTAEACRRAEAIIATKKFNARNRSED